MEKSTQSLLMATAVGAMTLGIFNGVAPSISDVSAAPPNDADVSRNTRIATWMTAGLVSGVAVLLRDPTVFVIGAFTIVGENLWIRSQNAVHPALPGGQMVTGKMTPAASSSPAPPAHMTAPAESEAPAQSVSPQYGAF